MYKSSIIILLVALCCIASVYTGKPLMFRCLIERSGSDSTIIDCGCGQKNAMHDGVPSYGHFGAAHRKYPSFIFYEFNRIISQYNTLKCISIIF
jgi:hypothetical protein